jgi:hypothetical protein
VKGTCDALRHEIDTANHRIQTIIVDQKRVRDNLRETPTESPLFRCYLKTLEEQEKEMDDLQARLKNCTATRRSPRRTMTSSLPT